MSALIAEDELVHEDDFVWLEDIDTLDYVRQSLDRLTTRRGKPPTTATAAWSATHCWVPGPSRPVPRVLSGAGCSGCFRTTGTPTPKVSTRPARLPRRWTRARWRPAARGARPSGQRAGRRLRRCGSWGSRCRCRASEGFQGPNCGPRVGSWPLRPAASRCGVFPGAVEGPA